MLAQRSLDGDPMFEQLVNGVVEAIFSSLSNVSSQQLRKRRVFRQSMSAHSLNGSIKRLATISCAVAIRLGFMPRPACASA